MNEELRARDVWRSLPVRAGLGAALVERVGARGWKPPRFAKGRRLFGRCGLPDPWDPSAPQVAVALGDVGIETAKRSPAPHAAPPPAAKSPGLPRVAPATPAAERPAPRIGESRTVDRKETEKAKHTPTTRPQSRDGTFGPGKVNQPVARLPMRPGVAAPTAAATPGPPPPAGPSPTAPSPGRVVELPMRPAPPPVPTPLVEPEELPMTPAPSPARIAASAESPPPAPAPPRRAAIPTGGLDDLFGMGGDNTRIRLPKKEEAPAVPRRPAVATEEDLKKAGIDRRPPPPKPPAVKPSGGGGGFDPDGGA